MCNLIRIISYCKDKSIDFISDFLINKNNNQEEINKYIEVQQRLEKLHEAIRRGVGIQYAYGIRF